MNPPQGLRSESEEQIDLSWNEITPPRNGGSAVITYILKYTDAEEPSADHNEWNTLVGAADTLCAGSEADSAASRTTCTYDADKKTVDFTHTGVGNKKMYYMVAAQNEWGTGKFSKPNCEVNEA